MKHIFLLGIAIIILSCKKESANSIKSAPPVGHWKWFKSVAWGSTTTPQNTGRTLGFIFNADSTCTRSGDLLQPSNGWGTYSYLTDPVMDRNFIIFLPSDTLSFYYSPNVQSPDTLILDDGSWVDGPVYYFVRVQ